MNIQEKDTLQSLHLKIIDDLDVKEILPNLFQNKMISNHDYKELVQLKETRSSKCQKLLLAIVQPGSKCTFAGFIRALRYKDVYAFLADTLEKELAEKIRNSVGISNENAGTNTTCQTDKESDIVYEPIRKFNVFTEKRKVISDLAHKLKKLSHDGDMNKFEKVIKVIDTKFQNNKLNISTNVKNRMHLADMKFASIEAEISAKRVQFDKSLREGDMFTHLESVIPFTSNPRVSSMSYLARSASAIAMGDSIDDGLAYLQFAKQHAEYVTPCKDTGMVYYIEVNLLSQKYERNPSEQLKADILQMSEQGIDQFRDENDEIKKDYQRMLLLKMVFCYLGVGLFCKKIDKAETTKKDIEQAKNVIDFIETSDIWQGMEKRRKMFFYVAKSEYYKQTGNLDLAVVHANAAYKLGCENNWKVERSNISEMVEDLKRKDHYACSDSGTADDDFLAELFEGILESEDELAQGINDIESKSNLDDDYVFNIVDQETNDIGKAMLNLKELTIHEQHTESGKDQPLNDHTERSASDMQGTDNVKMMDCDKQCNTCSQSQEQYLLVLKEVHLSSEPMSGASNDLTYLKGKKK